LTVECEALMRAALAHRDFALLWLAGLVSVLGDWILRAALPFYVYARTSSPLASGIALLVEAVPWLLLSSIAGVLADRWDRKRTLLLSDLASGAPLLALALAGPRAPLWAAYLGTFVVTAIGLVSGPAGNALLPQLVGERDLLAANALRSISGNVGRVVGSALGGALLALLGLPAVAAVDGASFLLSAAIMLLIVAPPRSSHDVTDTAVGWRGAVGRFWRAWVNGLRIVRREPAVAAIFTTMGVASFANGGLSALLAPFLQGVLRLGATQFGWMMAALGVGSLIGGLLVPLVGKAIGPVTLVACGIAASGIVWLAITHARTTPVLLPLFVLVGIPNMAWQVGLSTLLQGSVDNRYLGRVWGSYGTLIALVVVGATVLASVTASAVGIQRTLDMASVLYLSAGVLAAALLFRARRPALPFAADS
jgi:predicted MFS family arabinose efflux permease